MKSTSLKQFSRVIPVGLILGLTICSSDAIAQPRREILDRTQSAQVRNESINKDNQYETVAKCLSELKPDDSAVDRNSALIEKCELEFEARKLDIERNISLLEQETFWQIIAALGGLIGYILNRRWEVKKLETDRQKEIEDRKNRREKEFKIKLMDIIMNSEDPVEAKSKCEALSEIFPNDVKKTLCQKFNPYKYQSALSSNMKIEIFKALLAASKDNNLDAKDIDKVFDKLDEVVEQAKSELQEKIEQEEREQEKNKMNGDRPALTANNS